MKKSISTILAICLLISALFSLPACYVEPTESYKPNRTDETSTNDDTTTSTKSKITGFEFSPFTTMELSMTVGETEESYFIVNGDRDFSLDDIIFVSSDKSVAKIEFESQALTTYIYYKITPLSEGTATLYVQTKDGAVKSDEISITVSDPNNFNYEIVDTYYNLASDSIGYLWIECYALVKNTGKTNIYLSSGKFDIEDKNGHLIDTIDYVDVYPQVIAPGETGVYYETTIFEKGNINGKYNVVFKIDAKKATVPLVRYKVSDVSFSEDQFGYINVTGRVKNTSNKSDSLCYIGIVLYDKNDKVIGVDFTIITDEIAPGELCSFEKTFLYDYFGVKLKDVSKYEIYAYPFQYQFS